MTDSLIPTSALARQLGVSRRTIIRWASGEFFPKPVVFNRRLYFRSEEVQSWINTRDKFVTCETWGIPRVTKTPVCDSNQKIPKSPLYNPIGYTLQPLKPK